MWGQTTIVIHVGDCIQYIKQWSKYGFEWLRLRIRRSLLQHDTHQLPLIGYISGYYKTTPSPLHYLKQLGAPTTSQYHRNIDTGTGKEKRVGRARDSIYTTTAGCMWSHRKAQFVGAKHGQYCSTKVSIERNNCAGQKKCLFPVLTDDSCEWCKG